MSSDLIKAIRAQSKFSISQAITLIENEQEGGNKLLSNLFKYTGKAYRIGMTGPPGSGKSSLTGNLISAFRKENKKVAVIAVDPTSPFSGGAVLGDRIRMVEHHADPFVFIRSMATRGGQGGLALRTEDVGDIFDAAEFDIIIYETVGVGQIELDIMQAADSVIVVLVPESGDEVQMLKAGLMEIGDIFAINKADRPDANKLLVTLENIISNSPKDKNNWEPKVLQTIATEGKGIDALLQSIYSHQSFNKSTGTQNKKYEERYKRRLNNLINQRFMQNFWVKEKIDILESELLKDKSNRLSPFELFTQLIENE